MKYLIAGLGNPGAEYAETRHNIGFKVVDALALASTAVFRPGRLADVCEVRHKGRTLVLIKPTTYMNLSGKAVNYWLQEAKVPMQNLLVITDDLALPVGSIDYARLRFGVGSDFAKGRQVDYVLGQWTADDLLKVEPSISKAAEATLAFSCMDIGQVMTSFNR
jgi:PTH1 family peptidyl-tRNA hydrolase